MTTHQQAREYAKRSIVVVLQYEPGDGEVAVEAGVSCLETSYGDGWKGPGKESFNQGAIQCGSSWRGDRFSYTDTHPNADGTSTPYRIDFRKYPDVDAGWSDLCRVVYVNRGRSSVLAAAKSKDYYAVSKALHDTGYYEGYGKTVADRINNHYRALSRAIARADGARPTIVPANELPHTVRKGDGMRGAPDEAVRLMQYELQVSADGRFGEFTEAALKAYQRNHGLTPDGICGQKTWECLFHDDFTPVIAA